MMTSHSFSLFPKPPFRLDLTAWVLRRRPENEIDRWDGEFYRRVLVIGGKPVQVSLRQKGTVDEPELAVEVTGDGVGAGYEPLVAAAIARMFGIYHDLNEFYAFATSQPGLSALARTFRGAKPTRYPTLFESLVNGISCQQLSLTVGVLLLSRLARLYGPPLETNKGTFFAFPQPQDLAHADPEQMRAIGYSYAKADYIIGLAQLIEDGKIDLAALETLDDQQALAAVCTMRGVGRWTGEYFLLRGLGRTHIFPGDDVGARNNLQRFKNIPDKLTYDGVGEVLADWSRFGGLVYFHLLLKGLLESGQLNV